MVLVGQSITVAKYNTCLSLAPPAEYLQAIQASSVLACIFSIISILVFLGQLFTLTKGKRFSLSGIFQLLAGELSLFFILPGRHLHRTSQLLPSKYDAIDVCNFSFLFFSWLFLSLFCSPSLSPFLCLSPPSLSNLSWSLLTFSLSPPALSIMIAASIYTDRFHLSENAGWYGHCYILAWISFSITFISSIIYFVLRKKTA